ncbi:hypothetical protein WN944_007014 [Citrus x changshan-huyou]|uniref:MATH domain-containing protein n=1 Tax=Citrus x changshan-huyou TaxID=2935761 RepID=A0AAP0QTT1_9ROSI
MGKERRFHGLKLEWGFDQFIPLEEFNDASNGYLVGDTCVFGAEVLVKERNKCKGDQKWKILLLPKGLGEASGSHLSMFLALADSSTITSASTWFSATDEDWHVWKIENFSKLEYTIYESEVFVAGDQKWKILLLPKGLGEASGSHISMYLRLTDLSTITAGEWLNTSTQFGGWKKFVELNYLNKAGNGFLVNDVCIVEAEVPLLGISKAL